MYVNDVQAKIVILYVMYKFKLAISMSQLHKAIIDKDVLDYFMFMHYLHDLLDYGYIKVSSIENEPRYDIQDKGIEAVELFSNKIPPALRKKLNIAVEKLLGDYEKVMDIRTVTTALSENHYIAKCGIYEWNTPLLELNITVGNRNHAEKVASDFRKNATQIYQDIFGILNTENDIK